MQGFERKPIMVFCCYPILFWLFIYVSHITVISKYCSHKKSKSYLCQADWKALRGALVGCLALMRRKDGVGMVTISDAMAVTKSYVHNLHVQSLAQHDRKVGVHVYLFEYLNILVQIKVVKLFLCLFSAIFWSLAYLILLVHIAALL